ARGACVCLACHASPVNRRRIHVTNRMLAKLSGQRYTAGSFASNPMKLHRALTSLLILLLLFAQQAAFAHAISHLVKEPPAKEQLAHSKLCDKCVSFEKISGVAPAGVPVQFSLVLFFAQP